MRPPSSPTALRVKVRPRISSGDTWPLATSHTTRWEMTVVLPDPAPAVTFIDCAGSASMMTRCSVLGGKACAGSAAVRRASCSAL